MSISGNLIGQGSVFVPPAFSAAIALPRAAAARQRHGAVFIRLGCGPVAAKPRRAERLAAFSGKMINRPLKDGEQIFRFFGPARKTHGVDVGEAYAGGGWWGIGPPPQTAKEWRELAAVLDSFNGDGFFVTAKVVGDNGPKAVVGTVSEQFGEKIPGQYLPGGATQAFFYLEKTFSTDLGKFGQDFARGEKVPKIVDSATGLEFTFHRTGWTDANGIWGYVRGPGTASIQTARVGSREKATKENKEVMIYP